MHVASKGREGPAHDAHRADSAKGCHRRTSAAVESATACGAQGSHRLLDREGQCASSWLREMGTIRVTRKELELGVSVPLDERTRIVVGPDAALATVVGRMFSAGRAFPLPRSVDALSEAFRFSQTLEAVTAGLAVAHVGAGTEGAEELSKLRAEIMGAWLKGEPAKWLEQYDAGVPEERRWGTVEDRAMLRRLPDAPTGTSIASAPSPNQGTNEKTRDELIRQYQALRGLQTDGIAGPITRGSLIRDYFALSRRAKQGLASDDPPDDGAKPEPASLPFEVTAHGAADNFSLEDVAAVRRELAGESQEADGASTAPASEAEGDEQALELASGEDDRVDLFFFFASNGIDPTPAAAEGHEYLEWIKLATQNRLFDVDASAGATGTQLAMQLFDKTGSVVHARQRYSISGPQDFSGVTDSVGRLEHDDVPPGDYTLKLSLEFFEGKHKIVDEHSSPVIVLPGSSKPQVRMLGAVPRCTSTVLRGLLFDTNKAFLRPEALSVLEDVRLTYEQSSPGELLVVGHTDTTGTPSVNDPISLERAKATVAFLEDDADVWLEFFADSVPESRRWGPTEIALMRGAVGDEKLEGKPLIEAYMALDEAELDAADLRIPATAHGCGENFPLAAGGETLDERPPNDTEDSLDRRVELYFFEPEFGIVPKPPGENSPKGGTEYPIWRDMAVKSEQVVEGTLRLHFDFGDINAEGIEFVVEFSNGAFETGVLNLHGFAVVPRRTASYTLSLPNFEDEDWTVTEQ